MRVAIYVQHLLGTGHLVRMQTLAAALQSTGHETLLISGGRVTAVGNYQVFQLPVLKTLPGDFLTLLDENHEKVSDLWKSNRAERLVEAVVGFSPDIVVLETWPFGRRQMRFEILPLVRRLASMKTPPALVSSIRDVLQRRKLKRRQQTLSEVAEFIDLILVHGEAELTPLEESFEEANQLQSPVAYSGYLAAHHSGDANRGVKANSSGEIIVSAGGGATGVTLLQTAAATASEDTQVWRLLVGPNVENRIFESLGNRKISNLIVERNRKDFADLLTNCAASVSQFGYNTALDLLVADCPAVVVPYAEDGETEQTQRANCFQSRGYVVSLDQTKLSSQTLLGAIQQAKNRGTTDHTSRDLNGAENSVKILESHYNTMRN